MQNKVAGKRNFNPAGKKNQIKGKKKPTELVESPPATLNDKKKGMKRKQEKGPKENGDSNKKKMKMAFTGTAKLDDEKKVGEENGEDKMNRSQRKRMRNKQKRQMTRHSFSKIIDELKKGDSDTIQLAKSKIEAIKSRDALTNNARRKLKKWEGILKLCGIPYEGSTGKKVSAKGKKNQKPKTVQQKPKKAVTVEEESDENDAEEADDSDVEDDSPANSSQEFLALESAESEEEEEDEDSDDEAEDDDDEEDAEEEDAVDDESGEDDEKEEEEEEIPTPSKKTKPFKNQQQNDSPQKGKSRYVVFVGNLPYNIEKQQLSDHFKKVGEIHDIRIVTDPQTKKPKGFAYVEVKNEDSYQKALALHNTFIGGRKINVQYTQGGKKKGEDAKKDIKAKNMKLQAMRKEGKFGNKNPAQKRTQRRMKQGSK